LSTLGLDAILKKQMSAIHADLDAIAVESHYAVSRDRQFNAGIVGMWKMGYGFVSCHWSATSDGGQGLSAADNSRQARFVFQNRLLPKFTGNTIFAPHLRQAWFSE
jgi:hypothetical protein